MYILRYISRLFKYLKQNKYYWRIMSNNGRDHDRTIKSQRIALQQGFSAAGKLRQGKACILPSLRGGLPPKATALPRCSTLAWDRISTGDGRGRAWFLQSTSRPRCGGRANGEETSLPYPCSRFASEVHRGVHNRIIFVSSSSCYFFPYIFFLFFFFERNMIDSYT